jgi:hypothetical protein
VIGEKRGCDKETKNNYNVWKMGLFQGIDADMAHCGASGTNNFGFCLELRPKTASSPRVAPMPKAAGQWEIEKSATVNMIPPQMGNSFLKKIRCDGKNSGSASPMSQSVHCLPPFPDWQ